MRHTVRHHDHIAFGDAAAFTALDFFSANFIRGNGPWFGGSAAGHKRGGAFEHMKDVRVFGVNLRDAGSFAAARLHFELTVLQQRCPFGKSSTDFVALDEYYARCWRLRMSEGGQKREGQN